MNTQATITQDNAVLATWIDVELDGDLDQAGAWTATFEAGAEWPVDGVGPFVLRLRDGRVGNFLVARAAGFEYGRPVVVGEGIGAFAETRACRLQA